MGVCECECDARARSRRRAALRRDAHTCGAHLRRHGRDDGVEDLVFDGPEEQRVERHGVADGAVERVDDAVLQVGLGDGGDRDDEAVVTNGGAFHLTQQFFAQVRQQVDAQVRGLHRHHAVHPLRQKHHSEASRRHGTTQRHVVRPACEAAPRQSARGLWRRPSATRYSIPALAHGRVHCGGGDVAR